MKLLIRVFFIGLITLYSSGIFAQNTLDVLEGDQATQLNVVQSVLEAKLTERKSLREKIVTAELDDVGDLEIGLKEINAEIAELRESFEQIAVGTVDLGVFGADGGEFNWRNEMTEVMMPIIRNLQSLTEKPRKIEALRPQILSNNEQLKAANEALVSIGNSVSATDNKGTLDSLVALQENWKDQAQELERNTEVAKVRLSNLQKRNESFLDSFKCRSCDLI